MTSKPEFCKNCPINHVTEGYVPLHRGTGNELWVGEAAGEEEAASGKPFVGGAGAWLTSMCRAARIDRSSLNIINTIGCRPPENCYPTDPKWSQTVAHHFYKELADLEKKLAQARKKGNEQLTAELEETIAAKREALPLRVSTNGDGVRGVEYCREHHLAPVLWDSNASTVHGRSSWNRVVALGDQALRTLTGRKGILLWRGSPLPLRGQETLGPKVVPTLHPAYLMRNAVLFSVAIADLRKRASVPVEQYTLWPTMEEVKAFTSPEFAFDFEWDGDGDITLCGLSDRYNYAICVPWTKEFIPELRRIFESAKILIGHNIIGADTRWIDRLGWNISNAELVDTMLIQHLIQPDMRHSLAFVASVFSNKVFWKGSGDAEEDEDGNLVGTGAQWKTWDSPNSLPRELGGYGGCRSANEAFRLYNARDTDASFQCSIPLRTDLKRYEMEFVYRNVSVPAAFICRELSDRGLKIDSSKVGVIRDIISLQLAETEKKLPEGLAPYEEPTTKMVDAPTGTYKAVTKFCKGSKKHGHIHDRIGYTFDSPGVQTCAVCKLEVKSGKMKELKKLKIPTTKRIVPWNSTPQILKYAEKMGCRQVAHMKTGSATANKSARKIWGREHTEFALVDQLKKLGTQAQSFAKEELLNLDRIYFNLLVHGTSEGRLSSSGKRKGIDPNIQNQPKAIRKIFIPDFPGWGILCADIVQGENMLTAWLAKDWVRWERLNTPGFDEHSYMASRFFKKPFTDCLKGGILEVLRHAGKIINHGRNYGLGVIKTQMYLEEQGFFYSISDVREMIEIWKIENARTAKWQQETIELVEKQGFLENPFGRKRWFQGRDFATKGLAFLPASTLADTVLRMMVALYPNRFPNECRELRLAATAIYPKDWDLRIQVHDELTSQGPDETHLEAAQCVQQVMTQPWKELNDFRFAVELAYSTSSWGDAKVIKI